MKLVRTDDELAVYRLHKRLFPADSLDIDKNIRMWLLVDNGENVGFCTLKILNEDLVFLHRAGVLPSHGGKGLQRRMIRCRERYARAIGASEVITYVKINNIKSSYNLLKCGYEIYMPEYLYADYDCLYWKRKL